MPRERIDRTLVLAEFEKLATHALIDVKDRSGLLTWFEKTYPDKPLR